MFYVVMTDSFMSNWGMAKDKDNVLSFECKTYDDAEKLFNWATSLRPEMKRVRININQPKHKPNWYLQHKDINNMPSWYEKAGIEI